MVFSLFLQSRFLFVLRRSYCGKDGFATSFPAGDLHPLQHAGLSRRTAHNPNALINGTGYAEVRAAGWLIVIRFTPDFPNAHKLFRTEKNVDLYVYVLHV